RRVSHKSVRSRPRSRRGNLLRSLVVVGARSSQLHCALGSQRIGVPGNGDANKFRGGLHGNRDRGSLHFPQLRRNFDLSFCHARQESAFYRSHKLIGCSPIDGGRNVFSGLVIIGTSGNQLLGNPDQQGSVVPTDSQGNQGLRGGTREPFGQYPGVGHTHLAQIRGEVVLVEIQIRTVSRVVGRSPSRATTRLIPQLSHSCFQFSVINHGFPRG